LFRAFAAAVPVGETRAKQNARGDPDPRQIFGGKMQNEAKKGHPFLSAR